MESWRSGKEKFLQDVEKAYDAIGGSIAAELDEENHVRVSKSQWKTLLEDSERFSQLRKENVRLTASVEQHKTIAARVEELERDNRQLQQSLQDALRDLKPLSSIPATPVRGHDPLSSDPASTSKLERVENKASTKTVSAETYNNLAKKHNHVFEQWQFHKDQSEQYKRKCESQRKTVEEWEVAYHSLKGKLDRRDAMVKRLKEQLAREEPILGKEVAELLDQTSGDVVTMPASSSTKIHLEQVNDDNGGSKSGTPSMNDYLEQIKCNEKKKKKQQFTGTYSNPVIDSSLTSTNTWGIKSPQKPPAQQENRRISPTASKSISKKKRIIVDSQAEGGEYEEEVDDMLLRSPDLPPNDLRQPSVSEKEVIGDGHLSLPKLPPQSHHTRVSENPVAYIRDREELNPEANINKTPASHTEELGIPSSQETPQIISVRRVKKPRSRNTVKASTSKPIIKYEILSSPNGVARLLNSSDSLDLDDIGEKSATPRKQLRLLELSRGRRALSDETDATSRDSQGRALSQLRAVSEQAVDDTPFHHTKARRKASVLQPLNVNKQLLSREGGGRTPKRRRLLSDKAVEEIAEDGEIFIDHSNGAENIALLEDLLDKPSPAKAVLSLPQSSTPVKSSAIPAVKSNPAVHNEIPQAAHSSMHRYVPNVNHPHQIVAQLPSTSIKTPIPKDLTIPRTYGSEISNKRRVNVSTPTNIVSAPREVARESRLNITPSGRPIIAESSNSSKGQTSIAHKRQLRTKQTLQEWEHDPEQEPLRMRPAGSLRMEDFKVNPKYNQGYDFAYHEVVRGKEARKCLQGCTKPECCGNKFRTLAIATRPALPLTLSQEEADQLMLENYLGDNAYKLRNITDNQREELLIQAKTRQMANDYGRHKQAYERPATPPGFWRADFPTTQEEEEDRRRADEEYKRQVKQRYDEAMRPGGRYIFRDE